MSTDEVNKSHWEVAVILDNKLESVKKNQSKLCNLKEGKESSPPCEILLHSWKSSDKDEITVNDDVDKSVEIAEERCVTAW